jgi:hypothetical protein
MVGPVSLSGPPGRRPIGLVTNLDVRGVCAHVLDPRPPAVAAAAPFDLRFLLLFYSSWVLVVRAAGGMMVRLPRAAGSQAPPHRLTLHLEHIATGGACSLACHDASPADGGGRQSALYGI